MAMDVFTLLDTSKSEIFFFSISSAFLILIFSFIGNFFLKEEKLFTNTLAGLSINAAAIAFLVCGLTFAARLYIIGAIALSLFGLIRFMRTQYKKRTLLKNTLALKEANAKEHNTKTSIFAVYLLANITLTLLYLHGFDQDAPGYLLFNGHQPYFAGISLEIWQADYIGRIKVFDNFPGTYARYHFFNGSLIAQVLSFFPDKNLVTFMIARINVISLMIAAVWENVSPSEKPLKKWLLLLVCVIYAFSMLAFQVWWSIFTNAYSSIFFFILALIFFQKGRIGSCAFFLCCFGISTSRSLVPAIVLLMYICLRQHDVQQLGRLFRYKFFEIFRPAFSKFERCHWIAMSIFLLAAITMIATGRPSQSPFNFALFNDAWLSMMSPGMTHGSAMYREAILPPFRPSIEWYAFWSMLIFISIMFSERRNELLSLSRFFSPIEQGSKGKRWFFSAISCLTIISCLPFYEGRLIVFYYLLPILLAVAIAPQGLGKFVFIFCSISFLQVVFFDGAISIPNFALVDWVILYFFIICLSAIRTHRYIFLFIAILGAIWCIQVFPLKPMELFYLNRLDNHTKRIAISSIKLPNNKGIYCFTGDQQMAALMAVAGHRVGFSEDKTHDFAVSKEFTKQTSYDLKILKALCP